MITVAFSPDGRLLTSGHHDGVRLWNVSEQEQVGMLQGHKAMVISIAFSSDGKWLAAELQDGIVLLWEVNLQAGGAKDFLEVTPETD